MITGAIENNLSYICAEILADSIQIDNQLNTGDSVLIDANEILIDITKA
jgi:isoleucyl-tRNA synthetase